MGERIQRGNDESIIGAIVKEGALEETIEAGEFDLPAGPAKHAGEALRGAVTDANDPAAQGPTNSA